MSQEMQDAVQAYFDRFNAQDAQGIADLYADDATVTDPVGTPAKSGKAEILKFYTLAVKNGAKLSQQGSTRIAGNAAAFYQAVLPEHGWQFVDAQNVSNQTTLHYTKGGERLTLLTRHSAGVATVTIQIAAR